MAQRIWKLKVQKFESCSVFRVEENNVWDISAFKSQFCNVFIHMIKMKKCLEKSGKRSNFVLEKSWKTTVRFMYELWIIHWNNYVLIRLEMTWNRVVWLAPGPKKPSMLTAVYKYHIGQRAQCCVRRHVCLSVWRAREVARGCEARWGAPGRPYVYFCWIVTRRSSAAIDWLLPLRTSPRTVTLSCSWYCCCRDSDLAEWCDEMGVELSLMWGTWPA